MTTPDPNQEVLSQISSIESDLHNLHSKAQFTTLYNQLSSLQGTIGGFNNQIATVRKRGFVFEKGLEAQAQKLNREWIPIQANARRRIDQEAINIKTDLTNVEGQVSRLAALRGNPATARTRVPAVRSAVDNFKSKVSAAENIVSSMLNTIGNETRALKTLVDKIDWTLDALDSATFKLIATEGVVMAVEAVLVEGKEDKDDPKGVLFLTDQRLLFEQKQEVATKKVLFIATEKKLVQELIFETPLSTVEEVEATKRGLLKNEDHIDLIMGRGAPKPDAHLHLLGQDCREWQSRIKHVRDGGMDEDRAVKIKQEVISKVKDAPTICPQCGGAFDKPVLRGQDTITCDFCGHIVRL